MKNKLVGVVGIAMAMGSASALADPTRQPMERAIERVGENLARHPDNRGLRNARQRLQDNQVRQADRGKNQAPGQQRMDTVQRVESPTRPERPEVAARPERPEHPIRPERPEPPGHARR